MGRAHLHGAPALLRQTDRNEDGETKLLLNLGNTELVTVRGGLSKRQKVQTIMERHWSLSVQL